MATNYPARKATGNRARDVIDPLYREAEERVLNWLLANRYQVRDARGEKTYYDFRVGMGTGLAVYALDVKCDQYAHTTGRVAWEVLVEHRGTIRNGWGRDERLDYIAYVLPGVWRMMLVDVEAVRELLTKYEQGFKLPKEGEVVEFKKVGSDGRTAYGMALGIDYLRRNGCIVKEDSLGELHTQEQ